MARKISAVAAGFKRAARESRPLRVAGHTSGNAKLFARVALLDGDRPAVE
jgi:hypothetical protein